MARAPFAERAAHLAEVAKALGGARVTAAPQARVVDRAALVRRLDSVVAAGGEA